MAHISSDALRVKHEITPSSPYSKNGIRLKS